MKFYYPAHLILEVPTPIPYWLYALTLLNDSFSLFSYHCTSGHHLEICRGLVLSFITLPPPLPSVSLFQKASLFSWLLTWKQELFLPLVYHNVKVMLRNRKAAPIPVFSNCLRNCVCECVWGLCKERALPRSEVTGRARDLEAEWENKELGMNWVSDAGQLQWQWMECGLLWSFSSLRQWYF